MLGTPSLKRLRGQGSHSWAGEGHQVPRIGDTACDSPCGPCTLELGLWPLTQAVPCSLRLKAPICSSSVWLVRAPPTRSPMESPCLHLQEGEAHTTAKARWGPRAETPALGAEPAAAMQWGLGTARRWEQERDRAGGWSSSLSTGRPGLGEPGQGEVQVAQEGKV